MVGFFCGCTSVGGILLIPAIVVFSALGMHQAMATALFSFALMAVLGTWLHHRKGSIDWMQAIPLCFGAFLFGFIGAKANMYLSPVWLKYILAVQIIFAGLNVLRPLQKSCFNVTNCPMNVQRLALFLLGGFAGFMAGRARHFRSLHDQHGVSTAVFRCDGPALPGRGVYVGKHRQYAERFHRLRHGSVDNRS